MTVHAAPGSPTIVRHVVVAALCGVAAITYLSRNALGVVAQAIRRDLGLTEGHMSLVMGAFFLAYALLQIPGGHVGQVLGTRRALVLGTLISSAAAAAMGLGAVGLGAVGGIVVLVAAQLVMGAAQTAIFPCAVGSISHWTPPQGRAFACGGLTSFMSLGGAAATALAGWLLGWMEWPGVYLVLALPGVLWAAWFWTWFRDLPQQHPGVNAAELAVIRGGIRRPEGAAPCDDPGPDGPGSDGIGSDGIGSDGPGLDGPRSPAEPTPWRTMMSRRDLWLMCAQQFFRAAGYIFYPTWFPTYLKETRHVSEQDAGYLTSLPLLAVVVGNLLGGYAVDWIWHRTGSRRLSRRGVALPCLLACAGFCLVAGQATSAQSAVWLMAAGSFCFGIGSPASYAITIDKGGRHVTAVFSTMNMAGNIGATVCPTVVTWFVAWTGNWDSVLMLFAGMYLAAAACWAALDAEGSLFDKRPA